MDCASDAISKLVEWSEKAKELRETRSNSNGKYGIPNEKSDDGNGEENTDNKESIWDKIAKIFKKKIGKNPKEYRESVKR